MRALILITVLALAGCAATDTAQPPPTPTPTASATKVKLDEYARQMCQNLDRAVDKRNTGDATGANIDEFQAATDALQSQIAELRQMEARYDTDGVSAGKAAPHLRAWCYANAPS